MEDVRPVRDEIERRVRGLLNELGVATTSDRRPLIMITLVWLIIIAVLLLAMTCLGLAIRHHESASAASDENPGTDADRHPFDLMS